MAYLKAAGVGSNGSRRPSMSLSTGGQVAGAGVTQRAFLIRQKSTGEEVVVTLNSLKSPVGARAVINKWVFWNFP